MRREKRSAWHFAAAEASPGREGGEARPRLISDELQAPRLVPGEQRFKNHTNKTVRRR